MLDEDKDFSFTLRVRKISTPPIPSNYDLENAVPPSSDIPTNSRSTTEVQSSSRPNKGLHPGCWMFISHAFISAFETQEPYEPQSIQQAQADVMWES